MICIVHERVMIRGDYSELSQTKNNYGEFSWKDQLMIHWCKVYQPLLLHYMITATTISQVQLGVVGHILRVRDNSDKEMIEHEALVEH